MAKSIPSVHSINSELSTPKLYLIKKSIRYISIFNNILNLCHMNNISLNPTIDFEQTVILVFKLIFPNVIFILTNVFIPNYKI